MTKKKIISILFYQSFSQENPSRTKLPFPSQLPFPLSIPYLSSFGDISDSEYPRSFEKFYHLYFKMITEIFKGPTPTIDNRLYPNFWNYFVNYSTVNLDYSPS